MRLSETCKILGFLGKGSGVDNFGTEYTDLQLPKIKQEQWPLRVVSYTHG